jgi:hypothetical protein
MSAWSINEWIVNITTVIFLGLLFFCYDEDESNEN